MKIVDMVLNLLTILSNAYYCSPKLPLLKNTTEENLQSTLKIIWNFACFVETHCKIPKPMIKFAINLQGLKCDNSMEKKP